jgi:predicted Zn-dependent protease with MMP-like domain
MTIENFEELVREGIKAIPQKFLDMLDNVDIVVEENPTPEQLKKLKKIDNPQAVVIIGWQDIGY